MYFYKNKNGNLLISLDKLNETCLTLLNANTEDASKEKHVPFVEANKNEVTATIGEVVHPMLDNHFIQFVLLKTDKQYYLKQLKPNIEPKVTFKLQDDEKPLEVYEYCNLHGLWKKEL